MKKEILNIDSITAQNSFDAIANKKLSDFETLGDLYLSISPMFNLANAGHSEAPILKQEIEALKEEREKLTEELKKLKGEDGQ